MWEHGSGADVSIIGIPQYDRDGSNAVENGSDGVSDGRRVEGPVGGPGDRYRLGPDGVEQWSLHASQGPAHIGITFIEDGPQHIPQRGKGRSGAHTPPMLR